MARKRFHGLKKVKVRASWNKYNLYNLSRLRTPNSAYQTFYQQKWSAKSISRAYHGEQIREKQWQRMFTSKLDAVIPMDHKYLARYDGSELAAGRGSGLMSRPDPSKRENKPPLPVPYMNMTYAPIERRLDMAIFRALFASSARQARQLVVHGKVKVNGQKMPYPGYLLNPGDMYQVDIDSVMYATGAVKPTEQRREGRVVLRKRRNKNVSKEAAKAAGIERRKATLANAAAEGQDLLLKKKGKPVLKDSLVERNAIKEELKLLVDRVERALGQIKDRGVWSMHGRVVGSKRQKATKTLGRRPFILFMRKTSDTVRQWLRIPVQELDQKRLDLTREWLGLESHLPKRAREQSRLMAVTLQQKERQLERKERLKASSSEGESNVTEISSAEMKAQKPLGRKTESRTPEALEKYEQRRMEDVHGFREALARARENPIDSSKPYATPWAPRPYMSAFAFIPRYLEVNHTICSAVYLRHPVARPGLAEVPTPFPPENQQLAFNWYLRRR